MSNKFDILRCPNCGAELCSLGKKITCSGCKNEYTLKGAIPDLRLSRHDYYFNPVPRDRMRELTAEIENGEWSDVIEGFLKEVNHNPDWVDNLLAAGRYSWKLFLDLPDDAVALDLGCGLGNLSQSLLPHVADLYAMDLTFERLEFTEKRLKKFVPDGDVFLLAGGDGKMLPFADASFDLVCLSGVLEWVPDVDQLWESSGNKLQRVLKMIAVNLGDNNPKKMQIRFLQEIFRVLKPGGQIFVAIENRHNYQYFAGRPDHHSGLPYGALLPRWAVNLYSIWKNKKPYRTYTYGSKGYGKLMSSAGFSDNSLVGLYPGYSHLKELRPFDFERYCEKESTNPGLAVKFMRSKATSPAYGIVAQKRPTEKARKALFVDRLLKDVLERAGIEKDEYCLSQIFISDKEKTILQVRTVAGALAIRLPWESAATQQESTNHQWLTYFKNRELKDVLLPKPVAQGSYQGIRYFAEYWVDGEFFGGGQGEVNFPLIFGKALAAIKELRRHGDTEVIPFEGSVYQRHVELPLESIGAVLGADITVPIRELVSRLAAEKVIETGIRHGDFSASNFLGSKDSATPVLIDWEFGEIQGVGGLDEINYFDSLGRKLGYFDTMVDCLQELYRGLHSEFGQAFRTAVDEASKGGTNNTVFSDEDFKFYGTLYWLDHVEKQLRTSNRFDKKWLKSNVEKFIEQMVI